MERGNGSLDHRQHPPSGPESGFPVAGEEDGRGEPKPFSWKERGREPKRAGRGSRPAPDRPTLTTTPVHAASPLVEPRRSLPTRSRPRAHFRGGGGREGAVGVVTSPPCGTGGVWGASVGRPGTCCMCPGLCRVPFLHSDV